MNAQVTAPADDLRTVLAKREALWSAGFRPVAVYNMTLGNKDTGKNPRGREWEKRARLPIPEAAKVLPDPGVLNTGILCDGLRAIDIDFDDPETAELLRMVADLYLGFAPMRTRSNSGRCLLVYRAAVGEPPKRTFVAASGLGKIEVLGRGNQFVADGLHYSGARLEWNDGTLEGIGLTGLTAVTESDVDKFLASVIEITGPGVHRGPTEPSAMRSLLGQSGNPEDIMAVADVLPNDGPPDWEEWNNTGMAFFASADGDAVGYEAFERWSSKNDAHDPGACEERWDHWRSSPPTRVGMGKLVYMARQADPNFVKPSVVQKRAEAITVTAGELHTTATAGETAIVASGLPIYQRGPDLVRPVREEVEALKGKKTTTVMLRRLNTTAMVDVLSKSSDWQKYDARTKGMKPIDPPRPVAETILERQGQLKLPRVAGVITTPTLRPDGSILSAPGYDTVTELHHEADPNVVLTSAVSNPTRGRRQGSAGPVDGVAGRVPVRQ